MNVVIDVGAGQPTLVVQAGGSWQVALGHEGYAVQVCEDIVPGSSMCYIPADKPPRACLTTYQGGGQSIAFSTTDPNASSIDVTIAPIAEGLSEEEACAP